MAENESQILLRPTQINDISTIVAIANDSGLSFWSAESYADELENPAIVFLSAQVDGAVEGFVIGRFIRDADNSGELEIYNIGVSTEKRRQGIGRALLRRLVQESKERGGSAMWLEARESNLPAIRFYESFGFVKVYERRLYYSNPTENAVVFRLEFK